jgi:hypothetical protein
MGRWMQEDPINFAAGDYNLTRYVHNNSLNHADPSGLDDFGDYFKFGALIFGDGLVGLASDWEAGRRILLSPDSVSATARAALMGDMAAWDTLAFIAVSLGVVAHDAILNQRLPYIWGDIGAEVKDVGACFVAGTPLLTPEGSKPIEQFKPGDLLLSRDEHDPDGTVQARPVLEVFSHDGQVLQLRVGGREIRTTAEHPFWIVGKGWQAAKNLVEGDQLLSQDGNAIPVQQVAQTLAQERVYNLRVAEFRTYFVGCDEWGFSIWAHNTCWYHGTHSGETVSTLGLNLADFLGNDPEEPDKGFFATQNKAFAQTAAVSKTSWINFKKGTSHTPVLLVADDAVIGPFLRVPGVALEGGEEGEMYIPFELFPMVPRNAFRRTL